MSSTALKLSGAPAKAPGRPPLSVVRGGAGVRQAWFSLAMLAVLVLGLLATLVINTALAEGSYERGKLVTESTVLADRQESLTTDLDNLRAPAALAQEAMSMGMVPAQSAAFVRLADGAILGVAEAATADKRFTVITSPTLPKSTAKSSAAAPSSAPTSKD